MNVATVLTFQQKQFWPQVRRGIRERVAMFVCGRQQVPDWVRKMLRDYEPILDARWSFEDEQYLVERYSRVDKAWIPVLYWEGQLSIQIIETLREHDLWRFPNFESYLEYKRMLARRRREQIAAEQRSRILEAVDSLSTKQIQQFNEAERAFRTGETVILMGEDKETYQRMLDGHKKAAATAQTIDPSKSKAVYGSTFSHRVH